MNPPSAIQGAMGRERKPFTYTPGGLDLSEIKSERMAKRLMRNAMNQGVPEQPAQALQSPPTPSTPIAVPNYNCLPVQVFPTFNLPANPKSLLRTRSVPDPQREPPARMPPQSQAPQAANSRPSGIEHLRDTLNNNVPSIVNNNNYNNSRPASLYDYSMPGPGNHASLNRTNYGSDAFTAPILPEICYDAEICHVSQQNNSVPQTLTTPTVVSTPIDPTRNSDNKTAIDNSELLDFEIKPIAPINIERAVNNDDEQKEVKVVKKQVKKEKKVETQNGDQNGEAEAELTVKLPAKKSAAKTETKVDVVKKVLPDGSVEEVKTTTTKTTIDGRTEIKTKTETTITPKAVDVEEEEEEEEEEAGEVVVQEEEQNGEEEIVEQPEKVVVVKKTVQESSPKESSVRVVKKEEKSETTTKKVVVVQQSKKDEEEEEEEEEEVEEVVAEPVVVKQPPAQKPAPPPKEEPKVVEVEEEEEEEQEEEEVVEEKAEETKVEKTAPVKEKVEVEKEEEEEEEEVEETEEVEKEIKPVEGKKEKPEKTEDEEVEEDEEEYEEAEEPEEKPKPKEDKPAEPVQQVKEDEESPEEESEEEEVETEKEVSPKQAPVEEPKEEPKKSEPVQNEKKELPPQPAAPEPEVKVPLREPSIPLEKVEDVEIKPIGLVSKSHTESTQISTNTSDKSGPLSTQTEFNRYENIVTVNRTTRTLDHSYEQLTQQGVPTVKTYFAPERERVSTSPQPARPYQPVYPPPQQPERRHSLLLERLSTERQMPSELYQNSYQLNNQTYDQQKQWSQEPQSEVINVSNVKPSSITNQQWYQQNRKENVIYNNVLPSTTPAPPQQQWSQPPPQPQPQTQYQPSYTDNLPQDTSRPYQQQNSYPSYSPKPSNWASNSLSTSANTQSNQYSFLNKESTESYQNSTQQYSSSYVPPPWEQDASYVAPEISPQQYYQAPPPAAGTFSPTGQSGWKPTPPPAKFTKPPPTAYIPPAPNQSFVKPVIESQHQPGRKTYYSEYERRYITVPESTYIPNEAKFQPQPDASPQYYYDNNEPSEAVEHEWRKELREFTEKTSQTQQHTEQSSVNPPWEAEPKYAKTPSVQYTPTPSWSQTLRPQSWRERSFESEYVGSKEYSGVTKTNTLGRGRPLSSYGNSAPEPPTAQRPRGVSVDRYNPNNYQGPITSEHGPVQTHTHIPTPVAQAKSYHNPNVPAYHNRASAEPREHPVPIPQARNWGDQRTTPLQSRSFKYLQWITGTED